MSTVSEWQLSLTTEEFCIVVVVWCRLSLMMNNTSGQDEVDYVDYIDVAMRTTQRYYWSRGYWGDIWHTCVYVWEWNRISVWGRECC